MASNITFKTTPPEYSPVYNRVQCAVYENDATSRAEDNYKYVITVTTEAGDSEKWLVPLSPASTLYYGWLDISRMLETFIIQTLEPLTQDTGFVAAQEKGIIRYTISVLSGWNVAGVFTEDPDGVGAVTTSNLYVWGASFEHDAWTDQLNETTPFNTWLCNSTNGASAKFLTNNPNIKARITDLGRTNILTNTPGDIDHLLIKTFEADGTLIGSFVVDNSLGATPTTNRVLSVATAPQSINNIDNSNFSTGSQPVIGSDVSYYTLQLDKTGAGGTSSELLTVTLEEDCRYEVYRVQFLNKLGSFDYFNFKSRNELSTNIKRKTYTRAETIIETDGIRYSNKDNGESDYYVEYQDSIKLKSDYLTAAEYTWLKELVTSPQVYLEYTNTVGDKDYKPVFVTSTTWKEKILDIDKLFQLELEIKLGHINQRQRR
jgi:hypothetical protein